MALLLGGGVSLISLVEKAVEHVPNLIPALQTFFEFAMDGGWDLEEFREIEALCSPDDATNQRLSEAQLRRIVDQIARLYLVCHCVFEDPASHPSGREISRELSGQDHAFGLRIMGLLNEIPFVSELLPGNFVDMWPGVLPERTH